MNAAMIKEQGLSLDVTEAEAVTEETTEITDEAGAMTEAGTVTEAADDTEKTEDLDETGTEGGWGDEWDYLDIEDICKAEAAEETGEGQAANTDEEEPDDSSFSMPPKPEGKESAAANKSDAMILCEICNDKGVETFLAEDVSSIFVRFPDDGHWKIAGLNSGRFQAWLVLEGAAQRAV